MFNHTTLARISIDTGVPLITTRSGTVESQAVPMASYPPAADIHRPKNGYPADKYTQDSRSRLLAIPDLRFEYSYLRSIRPYIRLERSTSASAPMSVHPVDPALEDETQRNDIDKTISPIPVLTSEIIHVQWGKVIWITVRDQVISPLLQGTLW